MNAPVAKHACLLDTGLVDPDLVEEVEQLRLANAGLKALLKAQSRGMAKKTEQMRRERQRIRLYAREARTAHHAMVAEMRRLRCRVSHFAVRVHAVEERAEDAESLYLDAVERAESAEEEAGDAAAAEGEARDEAQVALKALSEAAASAERAERLNEYYEAAAAAARTRAAWAEEAADGTKQLAGLLRSRAEKAEAEAEQLRARDELAFAALEDAWRAQHQFRVRAARAEDELAAARQGKADAEARSLAVDMSESSQAWQAGYEAARRLARQRAGPAERAQASRAMGPAAGSPAHAGGAPVGDIAGDGDGSLAGPAAQQGRLQGSEAPTATAQSCRARGEGRGDSTGTSGTVIHYEMDDDWVHDFELV